MYFKDFKEEKLKLALEYYEIKDMQMFMFNHTWFRVNLLYCELQMYIENNNWLSINANDFITGSWKMEEKKK